MKLKFLTFTSLVLLLFACRSKSTIVSTKEYAPIASVSFPMEDNERKYWDSLCKIETIKAKIDIKNKKLYYTHIFGMVEDYKSDIEMDSLLNLYSIRSRNSPYFCTAPISKQNCYADVMRNEIDKLFGVKFIDSLRNTADKLFVLKHNDDIFEFEDCDMNSRYAKTDDYSKALELVKSDFWRNTPYPDNFKFRKENDKYSSMEANFILYKDNTISEPEIDFSFHNEENYHYTSYFSNRLKDFVKTSKWKASTSKGIPVNSKMNVLIFFK